MGGTLTKLLNNVVFTTSGLVYRCPAGITLLRPYRAISFLRPNRGLKPPAIFLRPFGAPEPPLQPCTRR